jgi:hypothetical protein
MNPTEFKQNANAKFNRIHSFLFFFISLLCAIEDSTSETTTCDSIERRSFPDIIDQIACSKRNSAINSPGVIFTAESKEDLIVFDMGWNKNIHYLPVEIYKSAPNLFSIGAPHCSIKTISKKNFEKLAKLEFLWLFNNEIEVIPAGAFEDLVSLKKISFGMQD